MIDYYLKKHCPLDKDKDNPRCSGCIWLDKSIRQCIFALNYPNEITIEEFKERIKRVNLEQQNKLSDPKRRFVL